MTTPAYPASGHWLVFQSFVSMSLSHFRRNGVGLAMTLAVPLLFLLLYGYAYLLSSPDRTISVGLLPEAAKATEWRSALPPESFRVQAIAPEKLAEHLSDGEPALILDRDPGSGRAIVYAAPYWRPAAELMLRAIDHADTPAGNLEGRLHVTDPGHSPFFMLPAIMLMALLNIGLFTGGAKLLQERARGTLRMFRMLPISIGWYFSAELATKLAIALAITAGYLVVAVGMFGLQLSWLQAAAVAVIAALNAAVFIAMGLALASALNNYAVGIHAFTLCNLLILFLGDFFFSASRFPITKGIALGLPSPYGLDLMRHAMFDIPLRFPVPLSLAVLAGWTVAMMAIAIRMFSYKAQE